MRTALGSLGEMAAFALAAAGFATLVADAQISMMVVFRDAFTGALPLVKVSVGVAAIFGPMNLYYPRAWARMPALGVLLIAACGGVAWAGWLVWNGVFTTLTVLVPDFARVALALVAATWREVGQVVAVRAAGEDQVLLAVSAAGG